MSLVLLVPLVLRSPTDRPVCSSVRHRYPNPMIGSVCPLIQFRVWYFLEGPPPAEAEKYTSAILEMILHQADMSRRPDDSEGVRAAESKYSGNDPSVAFAHDGGESRRTAANNWRRLFTLLNGCLWGDVGKLVHYCDDPDDLEYQAFGCKTCTS